MRNLYLLIWILIPFQIFAQLDLKVVNMEEVKHLGLDPRYISPNGQVLMSVDFQGTDKTSFQALYDLDQIDDWPLEGFPGTAPRSGCSIDLTGNGVDELIFGSGYQIYVYDIEGEPLPGWPNVVAHEISGSPAIGNVDSDPEPEIIVASSNYGVYGELYAFDIDGSLLPGFPIVLEGAAQHEPLLENIDSDPEYEILVNVRNWPDAFVYAYNGDGSLDPYWENVMLDYIPGCSLSSGDLNGDGVPEIIACSFWAMHVFDIKGNMQEGFPFVFEQDVRNVSYSNPVLADIDEDGLNEIVVATCNAQPVSDAGAVYVLNGDGSIVNGWPQYVWRWIYSPVSVADIDGDGHLDIIANDQSISDVPDNFIYGWNASGEALEGFPISDVEATFAQASIADIDGDNDLEAIFDNNVYDLKFQIFHHNGQPFETFDIDPGYSIMMTSPILKDINHDGHLNFMTASTDINNQESNQNIYDVTIPYIPENIPLGKFLYNDRNTNEYGSDMIIGIQEVYETLHEVYPNPFIDRIFFKNIKSSEGSAVFMLYNATGNLVFEKQLNLSENMEIKLKAELANGMYTYELQTNQEILKGKLFHNR